MDEQGVLNAVFDPVNNALKTSGATFPSEVVAVDFKATGKTGATAIPAILAGGTTSGAPTTGAHVVGEIVPDATGTIWVCTAAGTPGTWVANGSGVELAYAAATSDQAFSAGSALADLTGATITFTVGSRPVYVHSWCEVGIQPTAAKYMEWAVTDETNATKRDSFAYAAAANDTLQPETWERISTPGTYTRKVRVAAQTGGGTVTVYGLAYPQSFIRAVTA